MKKLFRHKLDPIQEVSSWNEVVNFITERYGVTKHQVDIEPYGNTEYIVWLKGKISGRFAAVGVINFNPYKD